MPMAKKFYVLFTKPLLVNLHRFAKLNYSQIGIRFVVANEPCVIQGQWGRRLEPEQKRLYFLQAAWLYFVRNMVLRQGGCVSLLQSEEIS